MRRPVRASSETSSGLISSLPTRRITACSLPFASVYSMVRKCVFFLATRKTGEADYGLMVTQKGRIVSDVIVIVMADHALVLAQRPVAESLAATFERHLMMEDAAVAPAGDELRVLSVHGPRAAFVHAAACAAGAQGGPLDRTGLVVCVHFESSKSARAHVRLSPS